jgi:hypothetical protein
MRAAYMWLRGYILLTTSLVHGIQLVAESCPPVSRHGLFVQVMNVIIHESNMFVSFSLKVTSYSILAKFCV